MKTRIKYIVNAARWFDRANGNTYHSVRITRVRDGFTIAGGWRYGYGDQYRYTALKLMCDVKWLPVKYRGMRGNGSPLASTYEKENGYPIMWNVTDGLKREMIANGEL